MLYNYKAEEYVQDVILEDYDILIDDIIDEYSTLRRNQALYVYAPSNVAKEIVFKLISASDEFWIHKEANDTLLYKKNKEVAITVCNDGMIFIEEAKGNNGKFKHSDGIGALNYVYDSFKKSDLDELTLDEDNILVFGFEDNEDSDCDGCCESCNRFEDEHSVKAVDKEEKKPGTATTSTAKYIINNKEVDKETFEKERNDLMKRFDKFDEDFTDMLQDSLLLQCAYRDRWNDVLKLLW